MWAAAMSRSCRLAPVLVLVLLLAGTGTARACDPALIDAALQQADSHLNFAMRAGDLESARLNLRRVAHAMGDAEAQLISCNCQSAPYEAASAAAEAHRAASAQEFADLASSVEATVSAFQLTLLAIDYDLCR